MTDETFDLPFGHPLHEVEGRLYGSSHIIHLVLDKDDEDERSLLASLGISCVLPSKLVIIVAPGWAVSDAFETFAVEIIAALPIDETFGDITYVRNRVHWFNKRVTKEMLPSLPSSRPTRPFIEAQWQGDQLDRVSLLNFSGLAPHLHIPAAAELSKGVALLFHRAEMNTLVTESQKPRGRPPLFESKESFLTAPSEVLRDADTKVSVARALYLLSRHSLWRGQSLDLKKCQENRKTQVFQNRHWTSRSKMQSAQ